jgi:hypothetical protein
MHHGIVRYLSAGYGPVTSFSVCAAYSRQTWDNRAVYYVYSAIAAAIVSAFICRSRKKQLLKKIKPSFIAWCKFPS